MGPATLSISKASIDISGGDGMRVVVRDAHLSVAGEVPVEVTLPFVEAPVDISDLFSGKISFASLTIDRPLVSLGVPGGSREAPTVNRMMEAINRVSDVVADEFERRKLEHVDVSNGELKIHGVLTRSYNGIDARITWDKDGNIHGTAQVAGHVAPWGIEFLRQAPRDGRDRQIAVLVSEITLAEIFKPDAVPRPRRGLGIPLSVKFDSRLSSEGVFKAANLVGRAIDGQFNIGATSVRFDDAAVSLAWVGEDPRIRVTQSHAIRGNTQVYYSGEITPPEAGSGGDWRVSLATELAQFGSADVPLPPFMLNEARLNGRFDLPSRTFFMDEIQLRAGTAKADMVGSVQVREDGPYLALAMDGRDVPIGLAQHLWPITLVPPARKWVLERIKSGMIEKASLNISVRPPGFNRNDPDPGWSGDDFSANMTFRDARIAPVGEVPDVYNLSGTLSVKNEVMTIHGTDGQIYTGSGRLISVPDVVFQIENLPDRFNKVGVLDLKLGGSVKEIARVIDSRPFTVMKRAKLQARAFSGDGELTIHARFPMRKKKLEMAEVDWQAEVVSENVSLDQEVNGHIIGDAAVKVTADPGQVHIIGKGVLDGLPADIDLLFPLGGSGVQARKGVMVTATADQLKKRGIDVTSLLSGPMMLSVDDAEGGKTFDIDLTKTTLRLAPLGWTKAKGVPAIASFQLEEKDDKLLIKDFQLQSDGVDVNGSLTLAKSGELETASFASFQLRAGDEASVSIQRVRKGRYKVVLVGDSFDARGLIRETRKPGETEGGKSPIKAVSVTASLDRVTGFNGARLDGFTGQIEVEGNTLTSAKLTGSIDGRSPFSFVLSSSGAGRSAQAQMGDAGAILRFLDLYKRMRGGTGLLSINMASNETWDGSFRVREMTITGDPAIRQLSNNSNILRSDRAADQLRNSAAARSGESSFQRLDVNFTRQGDTVTIRKGALKGGVLGGTVSGTMDLKTQTLDLTGTFVPIYALNNIFAKIPILGFALGGGSSEGLIGVTYRVTGPVSDPDIRVNPISAIAPGIFRKMFEYRQAN